MSERLQLALVVALTVLGMTCLVGVVIMELEGRTTVGVLSAVAGAVVVALTGLMTRWGDNLKPLTTQVDQIRHDLSANTAVTNKIATDVNGHNAALRQEIVDLKASLLRAALPPADRPATGKGPQPGT